MKIPNWLSDLRAEFQLLVEHPSMMSGLFLFGILKIPEYLISRTANGNKTFFETDEFPWIKNIENHWFEIRQELDKVLVDVDNIPNFQDIQHEQKLLTNDNRWKTYAFYAYGNKVTKNCRDCPNTARLLDSIPGMTTAMFSILRPEKAVPPHRGPYNGVLRYHLALKVPSPASSCGIRVGSDTRHWVEGKSLVFDDTHDHEAWNRTADTRVVLFVDIIRPLPERLGQLNEAIVRIIGSSAFISRVLENLENWHRKVDNLQAKI